MLKVVNYPKDAVPPDAYSSLDSVEGQTTKIFLAEREAVLKRKLSTEGGGLSMMVRPGTRASSVTVTLVSSVSGFVVPGDRVDVLVTIDRQGGSMENAITQTILQNIEVLAAGVQTEQKDQENKPNTDLQTITLLVDPPSAEKMALAMHEGKIHLTLRNPEDVDTMAVASVNTNQLVGRPNAAPAKTGGGRPAAPREKIVYRDAPKADIQEEKPAKVTVIKGGKQDSQVPANEKK
jgi:pilus assembly protein CpaB